MKKYEIKKSKKFKEIRDEKIQKIGKCELCGNTYGLELHHIIPRCCGGGDDEDNLILVCGKCHAMLNPKKDLVKIGIDTAHLQDYFRSTLPVLIWKSIRDVLEGGGLPNGGDVMDIVCSILNEEAENIKKMTILGAAKQAKHRIKGYV